MAESSGGGTTVQIGAIESYLNGPGDTTRRPGVIVIHEAYGLNDNIRSIADRFVEQGYRALAVDLFSHGGNRRFCMVRVMLSVLTNPLRSFSITDLDNTVRYLRKRPDVDPERIGVIGFCMGGTFTLALAVHNKQVAVAHAFYGAAPRPLERVALACPIAASYGADNRFFANQGRKLDQTLAQYNIPHDVKIYPGARHGFMNDHDPADATLFLRFLARVSGTEYDADATTDARRRIVSFFDRYLRAA